jgi:hypothetical protein
MKKLLTEWRKFLLEKNIIYSGILKLEPDNKALSELDAMQQMLPEEAIRLDLKDLHVTLVHQSILEPFKDKLKKIVLPEAPKIILDDKVFVRTSPGKKSWAVKLINQDEMREYVSEVMNLLGSPNIDPEPERRFHVSLANLTGNPFDSVK